MGFSWTHSLCESCLKNAHKESKMVKRTVTSIGGGSSEELYVCSRCGSTRKS